MNNCVAACIYCNMAIVAYNISRLHAAVAYAVASASERAGRMRKRYAKVCVYAHYKAGAVRTICQAGAAVYIRIAKELARIVDNGLAGTGCALGNRLAGL